MERARFSGLLDADHTPESFVRNALAEMEVFHRELALLALADWARADVVSDVLFPAVASLQRPSWGCWNGLLQALRGARKQALAAGAPEDRRRVEAAHALRDVLALQARRTGVGRADALGPLAELCGMQVRSRSPLSHLLALAIRLRNRVVHDAPTEPEWWSTTAAALRPLVGILAETAPLPCEAGDLPAPWFEEEGGERLLLGYRALRRDDRPAARRQLTLGVEVGDFLRLNRQALAAMDGRLSPEPADDPIETRYRSALGYASGLAAIDAGRPDEGAALLMNSLSEVGGAASTSTRFQACTALARAGRYADAAAQCHRAADEGFGTNQAFAILLAALLPAPAPPQVDEALLQAARAEVGRSPSRWPAPLLRGVLLEPEGDDEVLEAAARGSKRKGQLCEAHFYLGLRALVARRPAVARHHLEQTVAAGMPAYLETGMARALLDDASRWHGVGP